jgi:hypothetical protein
MRLAHEAKCREFRKTYHARDASEKARDLLRACQLFRTTQYPPTTTQIPKQTTKYVRSNKMEDKRYTNIDSSHFNDLR